jgi:hypothetical protein
MSRHNKARDALRQLPSRHASFLRTAVTLRNKLVELVCLLSDAIRGSLFILTAGRGRRLFDKLPKIVSQDRDAIVEFGKR